MNIKKIYNKVLSWGNKEEHKQKAGYIASADDGLNVVIANFHDYSPKYVHECWQNGTELNLALFR